MCFNQVLAKTISGCESGRMSGLDAAVCSRINLSRRDSCTLMCTGWEVMRSSTPPLSELVTLSRLPVHHIIWKVRTPNRTT